MKAIEDLRKEVVQLRTEMHERFERIEERLGTIFDVVVEGFHDLNLRTRRIDGGIARLEESMRQTQRELASFERDITEFIQDTNHQPLWSAMNLSLGYVKTTGRRMTRADFIQFENTFYTFGVTNAVGASWAVGPRPEQRSSNVLGELEKYPLDINMNYVLWLAGGSAATVANPAEWKVAADAYTQLYFENPGLAAQTGPARLRKLYAVGRDLNDVLRRAATRSVTRGGKRRPVFDALLDDYDAASSALVEFANRKSETWAQARQIKTLWQGVGEYLPENLRPTFPTMDVCSGPVPYGGWHTVDGVFQPIVSDSLPIALPDRHQGAYEWFSPGIVLSAVKQPGPLPLRLCYTAEWEGPTACPDNDRNCVDTLIMHTLSQYKRGGEWVTVRDLRTRWGQVRVWRDWRIFRYALIYNNWASVKHGQVLEPYWQDKSYRDEFLDSPTSSDRNASSQPNTDVTAQLEQQASDILRADIHDFYSELANDYPGAAKSLVDVLTANRLLITNMTELALPRALHGDEKLSSLVRGNRRLYDGDAGMLRDLTLDLGDRQQPPSEIAAAAGKRSAALRHVIRRYIGLIDKRQHSEGDLALQAYLARLDAVRRLIRFPVIEISPRMASLRGVGAAVRVSLRNRSLAVSLKKIRVSAPVSAIRISNGCAKAALPRGASCTISLRLARRPVRPISLDVRIHHSELRNAAALRVRLR